MISVMIVSCILVTKHNFYDYDAETLQDEKVLFRPFVIVFYRLISSLRRIVSFGNKK